jgi:hypothetical protein
MTTKTIGAGTTVTAGYTIGSAGLTLSNYGVVGSNAGAAHIGVYLTANGYVTNQTGGTIVSNGFAGIKAKAGVSATVYNYGLISGGTYGVNLRGGGNVANESGAFISASSGPGVYLAQSGNVENSGTIYGAVTGVNLKAGGTLNNDFGFITVSKDAAVYLGAPGTVINGFGTIVGASSGIRLLLGGYVLNGIHGTITGNGTYGVEFNAAGSLLNAGTITGKGGVAVGFAAGFNNLLTLYPGAAFSGVVNGGNSFGANHVSGILLGSATSIGTISGLGSEYIGFGTIAVAPKASWELSGANSFPTNYTAGFFGFYDAGTLTNVGSFGGVIALGTAAAFTNESGATVTGAVVVYGRMINAGDINAGDNGIGMLLGTTDPFTNQSGGTINSASVAVDAITSATVVNAGSLNGSFYGVRFVDGGGSVTNQASGTISGAFGVYKALTVVNAGYIGGKVTFQPSAATRLVFDPGATFGGDVTGGWTSDFNLVSTLALASGSSTGTISGIGSKYTGFNQTTINSNAAWVLTGANTVNAGYTLTSSGTLTNRGTLTNAGSISANVIGGTGSSVINLSGATISGTAEGVSFKAAGTVTNAGAINGSGGTAVSFPSGFTNLMVLDPGASFSGIVTGGNAIGGGSTSTLELALGSSTGTFGGIGSQYLDFAQVTIDASASWVLTGADNIGGGTLTDSGTLTNTGAVTGNVTVGSGGSFTNHTGGTITGTVYGVSAAPSPSVVNIGKISGGSYGVNLRGGGTVSNQSGGVLTPTALGVYAVASSTVVNTGSINAGVGVKLHAGGAVTNQSGGSITGVSDGAILLIGAGSVVNGGSIQGGLMANPATGVSLAAGGMVTNMSLGTINGFGAGVVIGGAAGTVVNAGSISGGNGTAVALAAGFTNRLILEPGSTITGTSNGGNTIGASSISTLELGSGTSTGTSTGTVSALGSNYINFDQVVVAPNADWTVNGVSTIVPRATISNSGTLTETGTMNVGGVVSNSGLFSGVLTLGSGGLVTNQSNGTITGGAFGITSATNGTVQNAGKINVTSVGVYVKGGPVTNQSGGTIAGGNVGVLLNGGTFTNQSGGTVSAGTVGVRAVVGSVASVVNSGSISGPSLIAGTGIGLYGGGSVTNQSGGFIFGSIGVSISGGGTIVNAGSIHGFGTGASFAPGFTNRLVLDPGSSIFGGANGGNTIGSTSISTLELASASSQGVLVGFGQLYKNFAQVLIDPGGSWEISNGSTFVAGTTLTDEGTMILEPVGSVTGDGATTIALTSGITASATEAVGSWTGLSTLVVGGAGAGSLLVSQAGEVGVSGGSTGGIDIGQSAGGKGNVTVSDSDTQLINTGTFLVGDNGLGSLDIDAGATVTTAPSAGAAMVIAKTSSASGSSANVVGGDLLVTGTLNDGNAGAGLIDIGPGGSVSAGELDLGDAASGVGVLTMAGTGASLTTTGALVVGTAGAGELSILNGALVTIGGDLDIGGASGSSGNVDVENTTGTLIIDGNLNVGVGGGVATMTIGLDTGVQLDNGGINQGKFSKIIAHTAFDPQYDNTNGGGFVLATGTNTFLAYFNNDDSGQLTQDASGDQSVLQVPTIYASSGSGLFQINSGDASLTLNADGVSGQTFQFTDNTGTLVIGIDQLATIDTPASGTGPFTAEANPNLGRYLIGGFGGTIAGMVAGDTITVDTTAAAHISYAGSGTVVAVIDNAAGTQVGTLAFASAGLAAEISIGSASASQLELVACFAAGTRIETVAGLVAVEDLRAGDLVVTHDGRSQPIVWVGSRAVDCARHPRPETVWPVKVLTSAFGENIPARDLYLSPDHAVFINDVLVPVRLLINGESITQVKRTAITYYHVELPEHAIMLAEGLTVESYLDIGDRANFDGEETIRLYPDFVTRLTPATAMAWETRGAAALVVSGPALVAAMRKVDPTAWPPMRAARAVA